MGEYRSILFVLGLTFLLSTASVALASSERVPVISQQKPLLLLSAAASSDQTDGTSRSRLIIRQAPSSFVEKPRDDVKHVKPDGPVAVQKVADPDPASEPKPVTKDNAPLIIKSAPPAVAEEQSSQNPSPDSEQKDEKISSSEASAPLGIPYETEAHAVKAIDRNIYLFSERMKERFSIWLERSAKYVDIMKRILREKSVPEELVFLPIVESGFNPNAYSHARAAGPWQFIEGTARRYGLVVDWWRDERKDPLKSTRAAASYLRDLHKMFGSWNLALAAYNAGEGRILKALRRSDADSYWDLLQTKQIRTETKEYVPRYIAATMIAQAPEKFGFRNLEYHEPMDYEEVTLYHPVDLDIIAKCAEVDVKEIRDLNPELRRWATPPNVPSYTIRIPAGSAEIFRENLEAIPVKDRFSYDRYTVKKKENLKTIAKKLNVPVGTLVALNNMGGLETIKAGDSIKVPPKDKFHADIDDRMAVKKAQKVAARKHKERKEHKEPKGASAAKKSKTKSKKKVKTKRT
jgi:membrane-bound lytic murein transglycosylase D